MRKEEQESRKDAMEAGSKIGAGFQGDGGGIEDWWRISR